MIKRTTANHGLIKAIVLIVIALLIVSYLGINIRDIVNSPAGQSNFSFAQQVLLAIWGVIKGPVMYLWHLFVTLVVTPLLHLVFQHASDALQATSTTP